MQQLTPRLALRSRYPLFVSPAQRRLDYQRRGQGLGIGPLAYFAISGAITGVTAAIRAIFSRKAPAQREYATAIVNDLEPLLQQNLQAYFSGPRTVSNQQAAVANFDSAWQLLSSSQYCGNPALGDPGRACIADRSRGGKWDWFSYYRDPIANDPDVKPDPVEVAVVGGTGVYRDPETGELRVQVEPGLSTPLLVLGGAAALLLLASMMGGRGNGKRGAR